MQLAFFTFLLLAKRCEKMRIMGNVYMSSSIHSMVASFLKDLCAAQRDNELLHMYTQDIVAKLGTNVRLRNCFRNR